MMKYWVDTKLSRNFSALNVSYPVFYPYNIYMEVKTNAFPLFLARYFRPPYGTVGARMRQRLAALLDDPYIVNWSVDVEDWLWANTDRPERQLRAFQRDVDRGGDLVVMHYLSWDTVQYFRDFIRIARDTGKEIMRVDQCMMDPDAPELR
jgi:peptidoglycan/xylan/chitin deacetylase (PgdA/CDA1 family)